MKKFIFTVLAVFAFVAVSAYNNMSFAEETAVQSFEYKIRRGDNLTHLAKRFDTTKEKLLAANTGGRCIKNENLILRGCKLAISDLVTAKETLRVLNEESRKVVMAEQKNMKLTKANSTKSFLLTGVGLIAGFLFIGLLIIMVRTAAFKERTEKDLREKDLALTDKEAGLKWLGLWRNGAVAQIKDLQLKLSLKTEELALQEGSREEIRRLKEENDGLVLKLSSALTKLGYLESLKPGMPFAFGSRERGVIKDGFVVEEVRCNHEGVLEVWSIKCCKCGALDIKLDNANMNSHYWKCQSKENPKETVDRA